MSSADRNAMTTFDHDLDALVAGTPADDRASDRPSDRALDDLSRAARQFHGLAASADRSTAATTQRTLDSIWEDLMITNNPSARTFTPPGASDRRLTRPFAIHHRRPNRRPAVTGWQGVLNGVLAAALILAIAAGFWRAYNYFGPGASGDGTGVPHLAGLTAQDATPSGSPVRVDLPTAAECTVEPLTIDRVMGLVEDPYNLDEMVGTPGPPPPSVIEPSTYPTQEMLDEIDTVHRQLVACAMAESPFQVWALVSAELIQDDVLWSLPVFADETEVRAYLEQLQTGLTDEQAMVLRTTYGAQPGSVIMVDTNPRNSITLPTDGSLDVVRVGALVCNEDGGVEQLIPGQADLATNGQSYFEYHYRPSEERWEFWSLLGAG